jgi:predicted RNase H-like HicB family nuclease
MTQTVLDRNTGKPYVYIRSDDKEWSGETMSIEQVDALIATLQSARDNAAEYLEVIPFMPA